MSYKEKKQELVEKYADVVALISRKENVDLGVAFDMFEANIEQGCMYGWRDAKVDFEALEVEARGTLNK